jgi:hypothetical protein
MPDYNIKPLPGKILSPEENPPGGQEVKSLIDDDLSINDYEGPRLIFPVSAPGRTC